CMCVVLWIPQNLAARPSGTGGTAPGPMLFVSHLPDGSSPIGEVLAFDGTTGLVQSTVLAHGTENLGHAGGLVYGADGYLYVANLDGLAGDSIIRVNPITGQHNTFSTD